MTIRETLNWASQKLTKTSLSPVLDSEVLLSFVLNRDKAWIYANEKNNLTHKQLTKFRDLLKKCSEYWPISYLTKHKEFFTFDFLVTPDVLVPRPETELLVETALERIKYYESRIKYMVDI